MPEVIDTLFAGAGPEAEAGSDRPFVLSGDGAWMVTAGRVDVFAVPLAGGEVAGSRTHLFRVECGGMLFGVDGPGHGVGLLAVGGAGTRVAAVPRRQLGAAAMDPARREALAARVDGWVTLLCAAVARDRVPEGVAEVEPGEPELPKGARYVRPGRPVAWLKHVEGASLLLGRPGLTVNGAFTPLSRGAWMEVQGRCRVDSLETADALEQGEAWDGLARLHGLVLACCARMAAEAAQAGRERMQEKGAAASGAFRGAMSRLVTTLDTPAPAARMRLRAAEEAAPGEDALLAACRLVGAALDLTVVPYPHEKGAPPPRDPLAAVARASRFRTRQVVLREGWWREDGGPLLAWMADDGRAVALVPAPGTRYTLHDPTARTETLVDAAVADTVKPVAFSFYRPFPDHKLGLRDVIRFGLQGCGRDLTMVVGLSAAGALLSLVTPIATGRIFNDVIPGAERDQLFQITLALVVVAVATFLFRLGSGVALARVEGRMGGATQAAVWDRVLGLPMPFFRPYSAGNLASRAMGIDGIRQQLSGATISALLSGLFSLVHFGLLYSYSPRLALWATGLIALSIVMTVFASKVARRSEHQIAALRGRLSGSVLQLLSSIAKLRTAAAEGQAFTLWARGFSEQRRLQFRARSVQNLITSFNAGYPVIATLVLYAVALPLMSGGEDPLRTGDFMAFMSSFATCLAGMLGASAALLGAMNVMPLYEQARPILETAPEVDVAKADPGVLTGAIDIERVVFRYNPDGAPIVRDLTMRIKPGEFVAFVGPSGSGKSTLLRLLLGFETPESGAVYYDGRELAGLDAQAVRRQIGVVLQNGRLMSGDIFTNIMGSTPGSQEDAWEAARMAGFDEDIRSMPMGMHTVVSEGGGTLSGGQRQRLMIARAIVQRPRILFFDEATSALDNRTQAIVTESLDRLSATRVVIAHRLSTILHADRIFVIEAGRIVQSGTYDELIRQEGLFADLAKRQLA